MSEGPEKELHQLAVFGELRALFPGVHIYIELVGPAVPKSRLATDAVFPLQCFMKNFSIVFYFLVFAHNLTGLPFSFHQILYLCIS
jgi:hypothetical protein